MLSTDASGDVGWGGCGQDVWAQGRWTAAEQPFSINWKELKAYEMALDVFGPLLANRIVYIKSANVAAIHCINVGRGRIDDLADLARAIRIKELRLGVESVAVHIPGGWLHQSARPQLQLGDQRSSNKYLDGGNDRLLHDCRLQRHGSSCDVVQPRGLCCLLRHPD